MSLVIVILGIGSLNVAIILELIAIFVDISDGDTLAIVGAVVSGVTAPDIACAAFSIALVVPLMPK